MGGRRRDGKRGKGGGKPKSPIERRKEGEKKGGREKWEGKEVGFFFPPPLQILALWVAGKLMERKALPPKPGC